MRPEWASEALSSTRALSTRLRFSACGSPGTHPLPDGNKRVTYLAMLEFLERNDISWKPPSVDETVETID
jgi:hypothetical protein